MSRSRVLPTTPQLFTLETTAIHSDAGVGLTGPFDGEEVCIQRLLSSMTEMAMGSQTQGHPRFLPAARDIWRKQAHSNS